MKILKNHKTNKIEDSVIIPFLEFLFKAGKEDISFSAIPEDVGKRPDYYIDSTNSLIEIKEIHDKESNQKHAQWGQIINKLQKATDRNTLLPSVKGTYLINTPERFKLYEFDKTATALLQEIKNGIDKQKNVEVNGINYEINKVSDQESVVVYGTYGGGGAIDPAGIVYQNIKNKVETANRQLAYVPSGKKVSKRILLLVNKYYFPLWDWDLFKAMSQIYKDLLRYENIDEIWYQIETKDKNITHRLLYRRSFFTQFEDEKVITVQEGDLEMFSSWFSALADLGDDEKSKLYTALTIFLAKDKPDEVFPEDEHREQMVRLGLWLIEKDQIKKANWLIRTFINDPDPPEPGEYTGDPQFNYDQNIRDGKDTMIITTVMGHLAWVVKELARKSERHKTENLQKAFEYCETVLNSRKNLYVIQNWIVPLIEVANRRLWLAEDNLELYKRFRSLILDQNEGLVAKYSQYPTITKFLSDVLHFMKDLTTEEVKFILDILVYTEEGYRLLIYYALYRQKHYKKDSEVAPVIEKIDPQIFKFSNDYALALFNKITLDEENLYPKLRSSIAWQFWRILDDAPEEFCYLSKWINNLFISPYNKETYSNLFHILEEWYGKETKCKNPAHTWLMQYIETITAYVDNDEIKGRNTWTSVDELIDKVALLHPQDLETILKTVTNIWLAGAYIGDLNIIFTAYQKIENSKIREEVKQLSQRLHKEIQKANPKVKDITWSA